MIELFDVVGKATKFPPLHIALTAVNVGVTLGVTTIVIVVVEAHWPTEGVNVYVVVAVLLIAGDHVPLIPFKEVIGRLSITPPSHTEFIVVNVGDTVLSQTLLLKTIP